MDAIENVYDRMTSYKKRKETLIRKMEEITMLCGVEASLIMFSDLEKGGGLLTWPDNHETVLEMADKVKWDMGRAREQDMDSWTEEMVGKERLSKTRIQSSIEDMEAQQLMSEWFAGRRSVKDLSSEEMRGLKYVVDEKQRVVRARMRDLMKPESASGLDIDTEDPDMYLNFASK